jgi:hypothetical protein
MRLLSDGRSLRIADPCLNQRPGEQGAIGRVRRIAHRRGYHGCSPSLVLPIHDFIKTTTIGIMAAYLPEVLFSVRIPEDY